MNSLFMKVNTTVILFSLLFSNFFRSLSYGESFTLYSFLFNHLDRSLVNHPNLHSSMRPISPLLWFSRDGSSWEYIVQGSSPHKCGQKSCCNALNAAVTAFLLDISAFLSSPYVPKVYPYHWRFLGQLSYLSTCLTDIHLIRVV